MNFFALFLLLCVPALLKAELPGGRAFQLSIENDSHNLGGPGSDQAYTNGFKITSIYPSNEIPDWMKTSLELSDRIQKELKKSKFNFSLSLGQQLYTPQNISDKNLITNDRPYAAWLFLSTGAYMKNASHSHSIEVSLGVVGPEAMGEKVQNSFHSLIGTFPAKGWSNELKSEPTLQTHYQQRLIYKKWKDQKSSSSLDILPFWGGSVGNVRLDAHLGSMVRWGYNVPDDFGPARPSAHEGHSFVKPSADLSKKYSLYGFAAQRASFVARDIFLDGNTFRSSYRVKKYPVVTETELGAVTHYQAYSAVWRFVVRSPEFEEKSRFNSFASVTLEVQLP